MCRAAAIEGRPVLTPRFVEALGYAFELHAKQRRKQTEIPYVAHLMAVSALVLEDGGDEDEAIAALLHDAIEDQSEHTSLEQIGHRFGPRVAKIVHACTDSHTLPKPPWRERKQAYLAGLPDKGESGALRVVASDKLHNARAVLSDYREVGEKLWDRFTGGREGTLWYYRSLADALRESGRVTRLAAELDRTVTELERLAAVG